MVSTHSDWGEILNFLFTSSKRSGYLGEIAVVDVPSDFDEIRVRVVEVKDVRIHAHTESEAEDALTQLEPEKHENEAKKQWN